MLSKNDLKEIEKLLGPVNKNLDKVEKELAVNTSSVIRMEGKIDTALELRKDVREVRQKVKDHEERITGLERI